MAVPPVRALVFDVFGTLFDWRSSIVRALESFGARRGIACDWPAFVDAWRAEYRPAMDRVRTGSRPWANLDVLHGEAFEVLAGRFALPELEPGDREWFVRRWHELEPWPDVRDGLERLRARYVLGTLSNGGVRLLIDLARHGDVRFDVVFSAESFGHYKPDPQTYLGACRLLSLDPHDVMMVAAHNDDLHAAASHGLRTCFVARPAEYTVPHAGDAGPAAGVDVAVRDLHELAQLAAS